MKLICEAEPSIEALSAARMTRVCHMARFLGCAVSRTDESGGMLPRSHKFIRHACSSSLSLVLYCIADGCSGDTPSSDRMAVYTN